jgi:hypothetical protein
MRRNPIGRFLLGATMVLTVALFLLPAQQRREGATEGRISLGLVSTGATVSFVRAGSGEWGMDIGGPGTPRISQQQPARLEVFNRDAPGPSLKEDVRQLAAGYKSVEMTGGIATARAELAYGSGVTFRVEDRWSVAGAVMSVRRRVEVAGNSPGGFYSAVLFSTQPEVTWPDLEFMAPGKLYADPTQDGDSSPGGTLNYAARRLSMRENYLAAPLFALSFRDGHSVTVFDPSPRGDTTTEESRAPTGTVMIDERYQFGALGAHENADGGVEFGFWLPGTVNDYVGGGGRQLTVATPIPSWRRRYHPIKQGLVQSYEVAFRFGQNETFPEVTRNSYRWAWETLKPAVNYIDVDAVRRMLIDFHADRVLTIEGRTGVPYLLDARTGKFMQRMDATRAAMGFCARNIEVADQFLMEADRDRGPRGERLRKLGLAIIDTFIRILPMSPPAGDGFDLFTGRITPAAWSIGQQPLLTICTDLRTLTLAYRREQKQGREHPEWLRWITAYADWLAPQQRSDGSFPRSWKPGTSEVYNASGTASYAPPVLFVPLAEVTGEDRYLQSAIRAGEYLWANYGVRGVYAGGAVDASSIQIFTDKEGGMASLDAFMSLYEATKQRKWLARALSAADYAESWIWIWNVPLPSHEKDTQFPWRNGPMVGLQGITAQGGGAGGGGDEYLDWAVALYAKAYKYSNDPHYLDVARILLHNTKAKLAMPSRTFGFLGPGWEQEGWAGQPGKWLTWMGANHLNGIYATEEFDPALFKQLCTKPGR